MRTAWRLAALLAMMRLRQARRGEPDSAFFLILVVIAAGVLGVGLWLFATLFRAVIAAEGVAAAEIMMLAACAGAALFQLLAGFRWGVEKLFLASDLELLLAAPVPHSTLVASKVAETAAASPISILFVAATIYGYAAARGWSYAIPLALASAVSLAVVSAMPGLVASMTLARLVPPRRLQTALALLPMLVTFPVALAGPILGSVFAGSGRSIQGRSDVLTVLRRLPSSLPAVAVVRLLEGRWRDSAAAAGGIVLAGAVAAGLTYVVFRSTFYVSWGRVNEGAGRRVGAPLLERYLEFLPGPVRAMVLKDWRSLRRDMRSLMQLFFPLFFIAIPFAGAVRAGSGPPRMFLIWAPFMFATSTLQSFALEGRNIALSRVCPVRGADLFSAKFIANVLPALALVWAAVIALGALRLNSPFMSIRLFLLAAWLLGGAVFINLAVGALFTDFRAEKPRVDVAPSFGAMIATFLFTGATIAVTGWPVPGVRAFDLAPAVRLLALVALGAMACACALLYRHAVARLDALDAP